MVPLKRHTPVRILLYPTMAEKAPSSSSITAPVSFSEPRPHPHPGQLLNIIGIFRDAIKTTTRNGKLMVQIMLLLVSPCSLLVFLHRLFAAPFLEKFEDKYDKPMVDWEDLRALLGIEALFLAGLWTILMFGMTITTHAAGLAYTGNSVSLKHLLSCTPWKQPIVTSVCVSIISVVYTILVIVFIKSINLITKEDAGQTWRGLMASLAALLYTYLASVSTLGLVVSVLDDECCGARALQKAVNLSRGRKFQGFFLMLILELLSIPIYILFYVASSDDDDEVGLFTLLGFGFIATILFCQVNMFTSVVFAVFYSECKRNNEGREIGIEPGYSLVSTKLQEKEDA